MLLRQRAAQGNLDPIVAAIMLDVDPLWRLNKHELRWLRMLAELDQYVEENGHSKVPQASSPLGSWVGAQRAKYRAGKLSADRISELESRAGWSWAPHDSSWINFIGLIGEFVDAHGHASIPSKEGEDDTKLGQSVLIQRMAYSRGTLSAERIAELEAFNGWCWDAREQSFQAGLAAYRAYVTREGHARIPREHQEGTCRSANG